MAWALSDIRTAFRSMTGRSSTTELANASILNYINDFYRYKFPMLAQIDRFDTTWIKTAQPTDDGEYSDDNDSNSLQDVVELKAPIFANRLEIKLVYTPEDFWRLYPPDEDFTTNPTLAIGSSNKAYVANAAFYYLISDYTRYKAAAETALSGDDVPQNYYGAWQIEIDADGTIEVQEADDNADGYATAALAVRGLPGRSSGNIVMGFVTVIDTSGDFTPGTTELDASGVTATYTDGDWRRRGQPAHILLHRTDGKVYVRPKPYDTYILQSQASAERPAALSGDTDTPTDQAWGLAIACGAALDFLSLKEFETERAGELLVLRDKEIRRIREKYIKQKQKQPMRACL